MAKMYRTEVSNYHDYLKGQGVGFLTSESCGLGMRLLFDLSDRGKRLVEMFFSVRCENPNWNSRVGAAEAVASIRMPRSILKELCIFALFLNGAQYVFDAHEEGAVVFSQHLVAVWADKGDPRNLDEFKKLRDDYNRVFDGKFKIWDNYSTSRAPGLTNTHVYSGRSI
jgi:hypothetical protein